METLFLLLDGVAILAVLFFSLKNDRLREGMPQIGLFRFSDPSSQAAQPPPSSRTTPRRSRR